MAIAKFPGLGKVLWFAMDGVQNPEKWRDENAGAKDLEARYERRVELKEALQHKVPSNPTPFEGRFSPMVDHGYKADSPFVAAIINEDGSLGWILPIQQYRENAIQFCNGLEVYLKGGEMHEQVPTKKTWAEFAAEVKAVRDEQKLQARQELLMSLETSEQVEA